MTLTCNTDLLESVGENFDVKFMRKRVPIGRTIHNLVNKRRITGLLIDKKRKHKRRVLTDDTLDDIGATLEHTPRKSLQHLAQEAGMSKWSKCCARTATHLLKQAVL
jgi:hypothetical protein